MELTQKQIADNKEEFLRILTSALQERKNANIDGLVNKLESSDFFIAPASTRYHCSIKGGLCLHSLNVYHNLKTLVEAKGLAERYPDSTVAVVALLHDLGKMDFYKQTSKNVKRYSDTGSKFDEMGRYDWVAEVGYMVRPDEEKPFMLGNHEETCEYMVRWFVPLKPEESAAILCHHGGLGYDSTQQTAFKIMNRYYLAALLHMADMLATYVDEVTHE